MHRLAFMGLAARAVVRGGAIVALADTNAARVGASVSLNGFANWIVENQLTAGGLCRYYNGGSHAAEESPLATAYAIFYLARRRRHEASRMGRALIELQAATGGNRFCSGGVPSIANDRSQLFYASDALVCAKAQLILYRTTRDTRFLESAGRFVSFVLALTHGAAAGMLVEDLPFPMQYVSSGGTYQNHLFTNVTMLFWQTLADYASAANDLRARTLYERGRAFLIANAQAPNGAFYDHYEPGYPPRPYDRARWSWHKTEPDGRQIAIADNMLMAAYGAFKMGALGTAKRFLEFLRPVDGAIYAYVDADDAGPGFQRGDVPYFDIVDSALYGLLVRGIVGANDPRIAAAERVLRAARGPAGGYRWGRSIRDEWVDRQAEALVTGYWAEKLLADA